jgi:hypothetical protein
MHGGEFIKRRGEKERKSVYTMQNFLPLLLILPFLENNF